MSKSKPVYVRTWIQTDMDTLWKYSQNPSLHQRWDLRFSSIEYLEKEKVEDDQHFRYQTNIGFGLAIKGTGVSRGEMIKENNERSSSLLFYSSHPLSLIKEGSGYWKYKPETDAVEFLTQYHYKTRGGIFGNLVDRFLFNPLLGWATSWSFDALRLWLEKGIRPEETIRKSVIHFLLCFGLAFVWIYQGLIPKLLFPHTGEVEMLEASGMFTGYESQFIAMIGLLQVIVGTLFLMPIRKKGLFTGSSIAVLLLGVGAFIVSPEQFIQPFNPVSLNIAVILLGIIGAINSNDLALARNCDRRKADKQT